MKNPEGGKCKCTRDAPTILDRFVCVDLTAHGHIFNHSNPKGVLTKYQLMSNILATGSVCLIVTLCWMNAFMDHQLT
jgi:hypothetical protein